MLTFSNLCLVTSFITERVNTEKQHVGRIDIPNYDAGRP